MARDAFLYDLQHSPACAKVRICLQVKGVPYRRIPPSVGDVLRDVPVPRLVLDGRPIVRADVIVRQLEVLWPAPALVPAESDVRAYSDLLEGWADAALGGVVRRLTWGPADARARMARATAREVTGGPLVWMVAAVLVRRAAGLACPAGETREALRDHVRVLETMLGERPFLLGRTPARADFAAFAQLACVRRVAPDLSFDAWPTVSAWLGRLDEMPAIATALGA